MSVDVLLAGDDAAATMRAILTATPLGRALYRYLALFRPAQRGLTWDRARALVEEILPAIASGRVERGGKVYAAPEAVWLAAIEQMLGNREALRLPLKSHGYLLSIIAAEAERAEAQVETQREAQRRVESAARGDPVGPAAPEGAARRREMPQHIRGALAAYTRGPATRIDIEEGGDGSAA
jgi:hypothetical protein